MYKSLLDESKSREMMRRRKSHAKRKAGMNGFVVSMLGLALTILVVALMVGIVFALQILTFTISLLLYEKKGIKR
jgi:nitrogen fixation/metabolism regulation signal transduction histidine kinase